MWEITSVTTETVSAEEVFAEEKKVKIQWAEMFTEMFDEISDEFDWHGFNVKIVVGGTTDAVYDKLIPENSTAGKEKDGVPIGYVDFVERTVYFFATVLADEMLYSAQFKHYNEIEEYVRGYIVHEHRHVEQVIAFETSGLNMEKVWQKVIAERDAYGYFGVMLEQDAFAVQFGCCEWTLDDIVKHYAE